MPEGGTSRCKSCLALVPAAVELRYKLRERIKRFERDRYPGEALLLVEWPDELLEAIGPWSGRGSERPDEAA